MGARVCVQTCQVLFLLASPELCEGQPGLRDVTQIHWRLEQETARLARCSAVVGRPSVVFLVQQEGVEEEETNEDEEEGNWTKEA